MGLVIKSNNEGPQPVEAGAWPAICVGYVDLGTQTSEYGGESSTRRKVMLFWDIPEQRITVDGKNLPRRISAKYSQSMFEKSGFRQMIDAWFGKLTPQQAAAFDVDACVGKPCMLNIVHKQKKDGKTFASVQSVMQLPRGMQRPQLETPTITYVIDTNGVFNMPGDDIPEWVKNIIRESAEFKEAHGGKPKEIPLPNESIPEEPPF